jgi:hypothetical protein
VTEESDNLVLRLVREIREMQAECAKKLAAIEASIARIEATLARIEGLVSKMNEELPR